MSVAFCHVFVAKEEPISSLRKMCENPKSDGPFDTSQINPIKSLTIACKIARAPVSKQNHIGESGRAEFNMQPVQDGGWGQYTDTPILSDGVT